LPVAKWKKAIRSVVALVTSDDWPFVHLDVKTTFLNGGLKETIYIGVPERFRNSTTSNKVCRLKKSLYGLKQAPCAWFDKINGFLEQ
jgi:hypothetical protein